MNFIDDAFIIDLFQSIEKMKSRAKILHEIFRQGFVHSPYERHGRQGKDETAEKTTRVSFQYLNFRLHKNKERHKQKQTVPDNDDSGKNQNTPDDRSDGNFGVIIFMNGVRKK